MEKSKTKLAGIALEAVIFGLLAALAWDNNSPGGVRVGLLFAVGALFLLAVTDRVREELVRIRTALQQTSNQFKRLPAESR
jgi:hypothetical protein